MGWISEKRSLLVADDHPLVLSGLQVLLAEEPSFQVVAACVDGATALRRIQELRPDIALLDLRMPELSGLEVLAALRRERLPCKVILLTASISDDQIFQSIKAGARGILLKDVAPNRLVECIQTVLAGRRWLPRQLGGAMPRYGPASGDDGMVSVRALTKREQQIAMLVAHGLSNAEIARQLGVTEFTVKAHLHNIYSRLGVTNRTELAVRAVQDTGDDGKDSGTD